MIESIEFAKYKRLENIQIPIGTGISLIMGTNGTCKSSLLHIISNSYQEIPNKSVMLSDDRCMKVIRGMNQRINPKIESLSKGDQKYNDPAPLQKGSYYKCHYSDGTIIEFRKHNQRNVKRYRIIPSYKSGGNQKLPYGLVIYLGLGRLNAYGEYQDDSNIKEISAQFEMPQEYQDEIIKTYQRFTQYEIDELKYERMGDIKKRGKFSTTKDGNDSNTISAGEDNLMIILTALYSLKYFCDCLVDEYKNTPAILLIDELDATLHPEFQIKLMDEFNKICVAYSNVSIVFTSHSISVFPECRDRKSNIIYLKDDFNTVSLLENPDEYKIKAMLDNKLNRDYYKNKKLPILVEDSQAKDFLELILNYFANESPFKDNCKEAISRLKVIEASFSCETLKTLFSGSGIDRANLPMIGIVDGDRNSFKNKYKSLICLPGDDSPEEFVFSLCKKIPELSDPAINQLLKRLETEFAIAGRYIKTKLIPQINEIDEICNQKKQIGESTKGLRRQLNKNIYENNRDIFLEMFKFWINDEANKNVLLEFYNDLRFCFQLNCEYYGIPKTIWRDDSVDHSQDSENSIEQPVLDKV